MAEPRTSAQPTEWPGRHFGLPASGPRSIARFGRRLAALVAALALGTTLGLAVLARKIPGIRKLLA